MDLENLNENSSEDNESLNVKPEVVEKEVSKEEFNSWLDSEEKSFKNETQEELGKSNSVGLDDQTFEQIKIETNVESDLNNINTDLEQTINIAKKESGEGDSQENNSATKTPEIFFESEKWTQIKNPVFNDDYYYRVVSERGYRDFKESGIVRSSPDGTESDVHGRFDLGHRPTPFPSFDKGEPDLTYLKNGENNFIFEYDKQLYKRGEKNPITENTIKGSHWAYRPINEEGKVLNEIKKEDLKNIYMVDKDKNFYTK